MLRAYGPGCDGSIIDANTQSIPDDAAWIDIELPQPPSDTGHLLLIFRSADGEAVAFHATSIPNGEFAAS